MRYIIYKAQEEEDGTYVIKGRYEERVDEPILDQRIPCKTKEEVLEFYNSLDPSTEIKDWKQVVKVFS